jgi:hypothetical protein
MFYMWHWAVEVWAIYVYGLCDAYKFYISSVHPPLTSKLEYSYSSESLFTILYKGYSESNLQW